MKKIILYLSFMVFAIGSFATGQEGDVVYINGESWVLLGKPIDDNAALHKALLDFLPEDRTTSTANWDGYTAYWSVRNHWLCLDSIKVEFMNWDTKEEYQKCIPAADLRRVFKFYYNNQHIVATWFSRRSIRAAKGNVVHYVHSGYERNTEYELIMTVNKGKVDIQNTYHNRVVVDGFSFTSQPIEKEDMRRLFPLQINKYPELKGVPRIMLSFKDIRVDSSGNLIDCEVTAMVWNFEEKKMKNVESIAEDVKKMLMNIRPWKTLYIHGEYIPEDKNGWTIPLYIE